MAPSIEKQCEKYHERTNEPKWNKSTRSVVAPEVAILYGFLVQSIKHSWKPTACGETQYLRVRKRNVEAHGTGPVRQIRVWRRTWIPTFYRAFFRSRAAYVPAVSFRRG